MVRASEGAGSGGWVLWAGSAAVFLCSRVARAESPEPGCSDARVVVEGTLDPHWSEPIHLLCEQLANMRDVDPSARLRIVPAGADIIIEASAGDGRATLRRIQSPDDLRLTVEALTLLPPQREQPEPTPAGVAETHAVAPVERPPAPTPSPSTTPSELRGLRVEVGGALVGRVARAPTYSSLGGEAYAAARLGDWLLALDTRWDAIEVLAQAGPPQFEMDSVGVGFWFAGRLAPSPAIHVDLGARALLLIETQSAQLGGVERVDSEAEIQLGSLARVLFGRSSWKWAVSFEANLSPSRVRRSIRVADGFPTLPTWSLGLGLGLAWGES